MLDRRPIIPVARLSKELIAALDASGRVFTEHQLRGFLSDRAPLWADEFGNYLNVLDTLQAHPSLRTLHVQGEVKATADRYTWGIASPYAVVLSLAPKGYFSHGTAATLHQLAAGDNHEPLYVNREQTLKPTSGATLTQEAVTRAFAGKPRQTRDRYRWRGGSAVVINGKWTGRLAVTSTAVDGTTVPVTTLERTLIDITVRPAYAGGASAVARAYKAARERVDLTVVASLLREMEYLYPYHQSIGFYCERAGWPQTELEPFRRLPIEIDFYLTHGMKEPRRDPSWRVYFPADWH